MLENAGNFINRLFGWGENTASYGKSVFDKYGKTILFIVLVYVAGLMFKGKLDVKV